MQSEYGWWIAAALLIAIELTSGTFYLLLYGVASAAAGLAAWAGAALVVQILVAAVIAVAGTFMLRRWKRGRSDGAPAADDFEVGHLVKLEAWFDGRGQVHYRGALWDAEAENADVDSTRPLLIRAVRGNTLIVGN